MVTRVRMIAACVGAFFVGVILSLTITSVVAGASRPPDPQGDDGKWNNHSKAIMWECLKQLKQEGVFTQQQVQDIKNAK